MDELEPVRHFLGPDLLPPHPLPQPAQGYTATPVLDRITCAECIEVLRHA